MSKFESIILAADKITKAYFESRRLLKRKRGEEGVLALSPELLETSSGDGAGAGAGAGIDPSSSSSSFDSISTAPAHETKSHDQELCKALVKTISIMTDVDFPAPFSCTADAMRWASHSILQARNRSITEARAERMKHFLTPEQTSQAFDLVNKLSAVLDS